nr:HlyD family secretion protein [Hoeflea prorocentri]
MPHVAPTDAFVREIRVAPGDHVHAGDVLMVLGSANLDDEIANARQLSDTVARKLQKAKTALAALRVAMGLEGEPALPITARHALAARYQAEFFADGDTENMHKLWLSLRDINVELAPAFAPDTVIAERLHALIGELETELNNLREIEALRKKRLEEARVVALFDGIVLQIAAHKDQFVTENAAVLQIEHNEPRTMLGWVSSEVADRVHLGQRVGISFANGDEVLSAEGRVSNVVAGPDPGQPNAFGMLVTIAPTGMDADTLRETFPADAPVNLTIHRDRLTRIDDWVLEQAHAALDMFQ